MGKIICTLNVTLDGFQDRMPEWHFDYMHGQAAELAGEVLEPAAALLMGRHTYESFASVWPTRSGDPFSDKFNAMRKYVLSSTLTDPEWNNTVVVGADPVAEIERIKSETAGDIVMYGYGPVARLLLAHGLLDELKFWIHPVLLGGPATPEQLVYNEASSKAVLQVVDHRLLDSGILVTTVAPA